MANKSSDVVVDYRSGETMPAWVREVIDTQLAIEAEDAKSAGSLGFMARALVIATMPYKDPKTDVFVRQNGDFRLRILAGYEGGIPYGIYPRLLMSWVTTEAVRKDSPVIELGDSLRYFLREILDISASGGKRGTGTRVTEQMKRLFGSLVTAQYSGTQEHKGFVLRNVLIADNLSLSPKDTTTFELPGQGKFELATTETQAPDLPETTEGSVKLWTPQDVEKAGTWKSHVKLSDSFFEECINSPVPIDLRAYKTLRGSPMAMDIYTWLTYRLSYTHGRSKPIRWEALMMQFGSGYGKKAISEQSSRQAVLDFKRGFLKALKLVEIVYPQANFKVTDTGFVLLPSRTHVMPKEKQKELF